MTHPLVLVWVLGPFEKTIFFFQSGEDDEESYPRKELTLFEFFPTTGLTFFFVHFSCKDRTHIHTHTHTQRKDNMH